jgi:hypothetical protein
MKKDNFPTSLANPDQMPAGESLPEEATAVGKNACRAGDLSQKLKGSMLV